MVCCVAYGCSNHSDRKIPGTTFHRFPKNPVKRQAWVKAVRRKDWVPGAKSVICSEHFLPEDMDRTSLCCVRIRENAVPKVFPGFLLHLKPNVSQKSTAEKRGPEKLDRLDGHQPPPELTEEDSSDVPGGDENISTEVLQLRNEVSMLKSELKRVNKLYEAAKKKLRAPQSRRRKSSK